IERSLPLPFHRLPVWGPSNAWHYGSLASNFRRDIHRWQLHRIISFVGQTNTNVKQHICSRCHNVRPIQDFPYATQVWWCHCCWQVQREKQNEQRRQRRLAALPQYLFRPRAKGWRAVRYRSKGGLAALSSLQRYQAQIECNRLVDKCKQKGIGLTPKKIASLWGNAIHIVKNVRTGKMR